jgi:hypothetical protein
MSRDIHFVLMIIFIAGSSLSIPNPSEFYWAVKYQYYIIYALSVGVGEKITFSEAAQPRQATAPHRT